MMTIAYFCIVVAIFIPIITVAYGKFSQLKDYNNSDPRGSYEKFTGRSKRAYYAQLNCYEGFAPFAAGVIIASMLHTNQNLIDLLAITYVLTRIVYVYFYILDRHVIRSVSWFIGLIATITLFFIGH